MSAIYPLSKQATVLLNPQPQQQTKDGVHAVVDEILRRSGCMTCGLLAILRCEFASDPDPDLSAHGATSANFQNF